MFFGKKKKTLLIEYIQRLAQKNHYGVSELNPGENDNVVCIQPYDLAGQVGPEKELVKKFGHQIRASAPLRLKKGVSITTQSKSSRVRPDYTESEPDFATPEQVYYIELRFS